MLQEPMMNKLTAMRLLGMVDGLKAQEQDPASRELSFLERLGLLVDHQWNWRENQALARRLHTAKLKGGACVEEIDYRTSRGLDKSVIRALSQKSAWVVNHENIFVLGPTGVGKSFVACALAQKACRDGHSALYTRAAALFRDLALARADGSLRGLLSRFSRIDVLGVALILDINEVKPRGQPYAAGEVSVRLQDPIDRLVRALVAVRCADPSRPSIVRHSASYGFRRDSCRSPRRCQCQAPNQVGAPGRSSYDRRRRYDSVYR